MMERSGSFAHIEEPETLVALLRRFLGATEHSAVDDH
jgi:hypothetical protein